MDILLSKSLTRESLKTLLTNFEVLPETHRLNVWISILELPNNKSGYICLRSKKSSPAGSLQLGSEFISSSSLNPSETKKLRRVYQAIHTHCPSLRQFPDFNVENFMQPFAALLASHELICFEVILTILVNYCQHWFDHIPSAPYTLLSMLDIILLKLEPDLFKHLANHGVRAINYAWNWMSNGFQTVVDPKEWLNLWDHILLNEPSFIYFLPIAGCILQQRFIKNAKTNEEIMNILQGVIHLDSQSLLKEAYRLNESIPSSLHPNKMTHSFRPLPKGYYPMLNPTDLITFNSESSSMSTLKLLLEKVEETAGEVNAVIEEGMMLRRRLLDA